MPILIILGWLVAWALLARVPVLGGRRDTELSTELGDVTVIIPARNEEDRLPLLLRSIQVQTLRPVQVLVVDDDSHDATAATARQFAGAEVIPAGPPPVGWTGKSWACATGAAHAEGEALVFLDADVELAPDALSCVAEKLAHHGGLVSVQPRHDIESAVEAASMPFNLVGIMALGIGSLIPPRRQWGAAGPCIATSKQDYEFIGGHASTAGAVAEDLELAALYNQAELSVHCLGGGSVVRFRMYRGLREVVTGWSKNMASGARRTPLFRGLAIALWVTAMLRATGIFLRVPQLNGVELLVAGIAYVAFSAQWRVMGRQIGRFGPWWLLWPVLSLFFVGIVLMSTFQTVFLRRVHWSGRLVPVGRS